MIKYYNKSLYSICLSAKVSSNYFHGTLSRATLLQLGPAVSLSSSSHLFNCFPLLRLQSLGYQSFDILHHSLMHISHHMTGKSPFLLMVNILLPLLFLVSVTRYLHVPLYVCLTKKHHNDNDSLRPL